MFIGPQPTHFFQHQVSTEREILEDNQENFVSDSKFFTTSQRSSHDFTTKTSKKISISLAEKHLNHQIKVLSSLNLPPSLVNHVIAYFPFNGNANDESGNSNHGTVHGAVLAPDRFGNPSKSYNFNGDYIEIPGGAFNFNDRFSISVLVKPATFQINSAIILEKTHNSSPKKAWVMGQDRHLNNWFYFSGFYAAGGGFYCWSLPIYS